MWMSTGPAGGPGLVMLSWVSGRKVNAVPAVPPKVTAFAPVSSLPVTVTTVPPDVDPDVGVIAVTAGGGPARVYPVTSTNRCAEPNDPLNNEIFPSTPTGTLTVFGMFCPAPKFRFEVFVCAIPVGHTVTYPGACGATTVTFNTTAATPTAGSPP